MEENSTKKIPAINLSVKNSGPALDLANVRSTNPNTARSLVTSRSFNNNTHRHNDRLTTSRPNFRKIFIEDYSKTIDWFKQFYSNN